MKAYVYILYSQKVNRYYIGSTNNLVRRMHEHTHKHTATTRKKDYKLMFSQEFETLTAARQMEVKLKRWKRRDLIERIIRDGTITAL